MKKLAIMGGVGAASTIAYAVIDAERYDSSEYRFCGFINDKDGKDSIQGYEVLGGLKDVPRLLDEEYYIINTIYKIDGQQFRVHLFNELHIPEHMLATFVHPKAFVAPNVQLSPGCVIMPNATVSSGVRFGGNCRVMSGAMVGHDNTIGDHSFFAANATIGSHLDIGEAAYIGLNATLGGALNVGRYAVVGMGSVVTKHVEEYAIVAGNPARHMRYVNDKPTEVE